jgi:hypothetical protein
MLVILLFVRSWVEFNMENKLLIKALSYGHAYYRLPFANTYVLEDELYIKNLICLWHAEQCYAAGEGDDWKQSINMLRSQISDHESVIANRKNTINNSL